MLKRIAVLIDGSFFLIRHRQILQKRDLYLPETVAKDLYTYAHRHVEADDLYRIFYYDCEPLAKKAHYPISKTAVDFAKTASARLRVDLHAQLRRKRKVALRLGKLSDGKAWTIRPPVLKNLLTGKTSFESLGDEDFTYDVKQKEVDMKIGIDIASLALKKQVDRIVLIAGDSDFVPAAKLARREGIDFILDPMGAPIKPQLHEHIDGLKSVQLGPQKKKKR